MLLVLGGCHTPSAMASVGFGPTLPVGDSLAHDVGISMHAVAGIDDGGMHATYRRVGDTQELALGFSAFSVKGVSKDLAAFMRIGINIIEWDRVGNDDGAGVLGPSLELGIGQGAGMCFSVTASRDLRFNDRDDTFVGMNASFCALAERKHFRPFATRYNFSARR
ncbi:MAG: hypothetical protein SFX73_38465 [Kofleriaceae bacterium]|nr:hypothetical protein [Kofleriaceae bacterium]